MQLITKISSLVELNRVINNKILKKFTSLFNSSPIDLFSYRKYYETGKHLALCTREDWQDHYLHNIDDIGPVFRKAIIDATKYKNVYFLWPNKRKDQFLKELWSFNIWNGISIFYKDNQHVESFTFACNQNTKLANNYFINNLEILNYYIEYFSSIKKYIKISKNQLPTLKNPILFNKKEKNHIEKIDMISQRERECLMLISKGHTAKSGADVLNISYRTFEKHIFNIKKKTNLYTKPQILSLLVNTKSKL